YFAREVLDLLSPEEERFLLDTSVLERLSGSLGEALTGRADAHLILANLADRNLFVFRLDRRGGGVRRRRPFLAFLRRRRPREAPPRARRARLRAAAWHGRHGDEATALRHLVEAAACRRVPVLASSGSSSRWRAGGSTSAAASSPVHTSGGSSAAG